MQYIRRNMLVTQDTTFIDEVRALDPHVKVVQDAREALRLAPYASLVLVGDDMALDVDEVLVEGKRLHGNALLLCPSEPIEEREWSLAAPLGITSVVCLPRDAEFVQGQLKPFGCITRQLGAYAEGRERAARDLAEVHYLGMVAYLDGEGESSVELVELAQALERMGLEECFECQCYGGFHVAGECSKAQ